MKKIIIAFIFLVLVQKVGYCDTTIKIPADFLSQIAKGVEIKTDMNYIKRILINQIMKNSSINGVKLKDFSAQNLIEYFNEDEIFKKLGSNKLVEPNTGATLEFKSDGKCKRDGVCSILVDLNGDKGPNELWTQADVVKDRLIFTIKSNSEDGVDIGFPNF